MSERLSAEREAAIREVIKSRDYDPTYIDLFWQHMHDMLVELDAVRAENKDLRAALGRYSVAHNMLALQESARCDAVCNCDNCKFARAVLENTR